jgi:hypothetical protein
VVAQLDREKVGIARSKYGLPNPAVESAVRKGELGDGPAKAVFQDRLGGLNLLLERLGRKAGQVGMAHSVGPDHDAVAIHLFDHPPVKMAGPADEVGDEERHEARSLRASEARKSMGVVAVAPVIEGQENLASPGEGGLVALGQESLGRDQIGLKHRRVCLEFPVAQAPRIGRWASAQSMVVERDHVLVTTFQAPADPPDAAFAGGAV